MNKKKNFNHHVFLVIALIITGLFFLFQSNRTNSIQTFLQDIKDTNKKGFDSLQNEINYENAVYSQLQASINNNDFVTAHSLIDTLLAEHKISIAHVYKGMIYDKQANYSKAIEEYNTAIEKDEFSLGLSKRADVYLKLNKLDLAMQDYKKIYEWNYDFSSEIAYIFELKKMKDSALKYYLIYAEHYPQDRLISAKIDSLGN